MNKHAQKWVEALRSGEFGQATSALRKDDGYCCLGVACEVYRRETGNGKWDSPNSVDSCFSFAVDGHKMGGELPYPVRDWLGIRTSSGAYHNFDCSLVRKNDRGATFEEIAAIIESEPDGLFQGEAGP